MLTHGGAGLSSVPTEARTEASDRELMATLAGGELTALGELYDRHARELFGLALWRIGRRAEAEDVVQEVFVKLARTTADLSRVRDPRAYLMKMTHRLSIDSLRRVRPSLPLAAAELLEASTPSPDRAAEAERLSAHLGRLPPEQREVIYLRHFAGLSHAEVGRAVGVSLFTAASRYRLGMRRLRRLMGEA